MTRKFLICQAQPCSGRVKSKLERRRCGAPEDPSVTQGREEREGSSAMRQRSAREPEKEREYSPKHATGASLAEFVASGDASGCSDIRGIRTGAQAL
jgi:hypothetical protein